MKDTIKTIIKDFHERGLPKYKIRDIQVPLNSGKILTIIGSRRAGKTYLMHQVMSEIKDITNIVYINFEDERLDITSKDMNLILESYFELYPDKKDEDIYFFFDEIQEIEGWEKFIRRLYDSITRKIFITGSSAKLLSKEIATSLRGRTISYEVFPLSFKEYLSFRDIKQDITSTRGKSRVVKALEEFMKSGGFPETVEMNPVIHQKTLTTYFEVMQYRDVIERYGITNTLPFKFFIKHLLSNTSKEFSINKIFNSLKSQGVNVSKDSLYKYIEYIEDAYILFTVSNFSESLRNHIIKKTYSVDTGLSMILSFVLSKDMGRVLENLVFLELRRRGKDIFYYKDQKECDFLIKNRDKIAKSIQVCYELNQENENREINGLKDAMSRFKLKKGTIITWDQEKDLGNIEVVPVYKWLLEKW